MSYSKWPDADDTHHQGTPGDKWYNRPGGNPRNDAAQKADQKSRADRWLRAVPRSALNLSSSDSPDAVLRTGTETFDGKTWAWEVRYDKSSHTGYLTDPAGRVFATPTGQTSFEAVMDIFARHITNKAPMKYLC